MSTVKANTILPDDPGQNITLGASGDTISVAGNDLRVNTVKDKGGNTLWTSDGAGTLSDVNSGFALDEQLLLTQTASNSTDMGFTTQLTSTYSTYCFKWIECQSVSDETSFAFNGSTNSGATYNVDKISTFYYTWNSSAGGTGSLTQWDTGQLDNADAGTVYQRLNMGTDDYVARPEANCSGELWLFDPSNTSKITNWMSVGTGIDSTPGVYGVYTSGYFDTASAINAINFHFITPSTGWNGTVKLYGII